MQTLYLTSPSSCSNQLSVSYMASLSVYCLGFNGGNKLQDKPM